MSNRLLLETWALIVLSSLGTSAGAAPPADLASMTGQRADLASSAYHYRADRPADQNDPESWILVMQYAGQAIDRAVPADVQAPAVKQVLRALLWEEVRQIRTVEVVWSDDRHPPADELALLYADSDQWWKTGTKKAARAEVSPDGRRHVFTIPQDTLGLLREHRKLSLRKADYDPERDWFNAGWHHQCAYERNASIHLAWDDAPNFLRTMLNQYAVHIGPGPYTFNEHSTRGPEDKPFEEAGFMERFRDMLVFEEGSGLWLARATPRAWLEQGKKSVHPEG